MNEKDVLNTFYLKVLVENDLYKQITASTEGAKIKNGKKGRERIIKDFIQNLPEQYKKIPDCEKEVRDTLERMENKRKEQHER